MRDTIFSARKKDFRIDTFASGGPGGQHQNKTQSGVRITHIATGISAECRESRSAHQNKAAAFRRVATLLVQHVLGNQRKARWPGSDETVRTYHEPDNRVVDHLTGVRTPYPDTLDGKAIDAQITARRAAMTPA